MVGDLWSSLVHDMGHPLAVLFAAHMVALTLGFLGNELVENFPIHLRPDSDGRLAIVRNNCGYWWKIQAIC